MLTPFGLFAANQNYCDGETLSLTVVLTLVGLFAAWKNYIDIEAIASLEKLLRPKKTVSMLILFGLFGWKQNYCDNETVSM